MKYKVSLLPEINKKRLANNKKIEKIRSVALVALMMSFVFLVLVVATQAYANAKLKEITALNNEYKQKVEQLEQYRQINATLQSKIELIKSIQVDDPQICSFVAAISNLKSPGVSIDSIEFTDWKCSRTTLITGSCTTREEYLAYEEALNKISGVTAVACVGYNQGVGDVSTTFMVNVTCEGGKEAFVSPEETTAAANGTEGTTDTTDTSAEASTEASTEAK
ncbi:MAG: hypothetical protein ACI4IF_05450 [Acutalibacteraceae bacterium]